MSLATPAPSGRSSSHAVLVTGATGFLGGAFLDRMLSSEGPGPVRYVLLARDGGGTDARSRILARLGRFRGREAAEQALSHCDVVSADLRQPDTLDHPLLDEVSHVVHLGANTSFISSQDVWKTNRDGTLALARRMLRSPKLQRFVDVSTAMICGTQPPHRVLEDAYPAKVAHLVDYTASKAAAEAALLKELPDLPLVIARPSIVVGHTRLGCVPSGSIFWVFRALHALGVVSADPAHTGIDVVPVDWVADALASLTFAEGLRHQRYHLSAGQVGRTNLAKLTQAFDAALGLAHDPARFKIVASDDVRSDRAHIAARCGRLDGRRMELVLALYLAFCELDVTFDNTRILETGVAPPPPLSAYVSTCLAQPAGMGIIEQADDEL